MKSISCLFFVCLLVSLTRPAQAEPELKGLPGELAGYLKGVPKTVSVTGESEVKVEAEIATLYGREFVAALSAVPACSFVADGSAVTVRAKGRHARSSS